MKKIENSFAVSGFVGKDAETRTFENASVARFAIAVHRSEKDSSQSVSAFLSVEAWRRNDNLKDFELLTKGRMITVEGYFKPEEWTDKESGEKRSRIILTATKVYATIEVESPAEPAQQETEEKKTPKKTSKKTSKKQK